MQLGELFERARATQRLELPFIALHDAQQSVWDSKARFNVLACGRRWGKTVLGIQAAMDALSRGERVAWGAPNYKYLKEPWDELSTLLAPFATKVNHSEKRIQLSNGGRVDFWTLDDPNAGRGFKYHLWIIDEAAMVAGLSGLWTKAIQPTLADYSGGAWFLSTPRGPTGAFYDFYRKGSDDFKSWRMPTSSNPYIPPAEINKEHLLSQGVMLSTYIQEYEAGFVMPSGAVFDCLDLEKNSYDPRDVSSKGRPVYLGWDFGSANTACTIAFDDDAEKDPTLYVPMSYHASGDDESIHIERIRNKLAAREKWAVGGSNSEDDIRQRFKDAGMKISRPRVTGQGSYDARILAVYQLLRTGRLKIAKGDPLLDELASMTYKTDGDGRVLDMVEDRNIYHRFDSLGYLAVTWADPPKDFKKVGSRFK